MILLSWGDCETPTPLTPLAVFLPALEDPRWEVADRAGLGLAGLQKDLVLARGLDPGRSGAWTARTSALRDANTDDDVLSLIGE